MPHVLQCSKAQFVRNSLEFSILLWLLNVIYFFNIKVKNYPYIFKFLMMSKVTLVSLFYHLNVQSKIIFRKICILNLIFRYL
jgi:hypothetical protein